MDSQGFYAGGVSVSFSDAAVIFEDGYANKPGEFVPRQSTRTTLSCVAHGGPSGGTATFSISGDDKLVRVMGRSLPVTVTVPPEQRVAFEVVYEGKEPSGNENDIKVTATFTEEENYVMTDRAGRTDPYPNWSAGTLTWKVPIGWRRIPRGYENQLATDEIDYARHRDKDSRPLFIGGREDAYTQTFKIEANGTSSIRKFGYKLERDRWLPFGTVSQTGEN